MMALCLLGRGPLAAVTRSQWYPIRSLHSLPLTAGVARDPQSRGRRRRTRGGWWWCTTTAGRWRSSSSPTRSRFAPRDRARVNEGEKCQGPRGWRLE